MYKVKVIEYATSEVVKVVESPSERQAEKIERGMNINLDHGSFYTSVDESNSDQLSDSSPTS